MVDREEGPDRAGMPQQDIGSCPHGTGNQNRPAGFLKWRSLHPLSIKGPGSPFAVDVELNLARAMGLQLGYIMGHIIHRIDPGRLIRAKEPLYSLTHQKAHDLAVGEGIVGCPVHGLEVILPLRGGGFKEQKLAVRRL
ncbi:hypothetical protein ES703_18514 [subsurface metagenome]